MKPARGGHRGGGRGGRGRNYSSRGRTPPSGYVYVPRSPAEAHLDDASPGTGSSGIGRRNSEISPVDGVTRKFTGMLSPDHSYGPSLVTHGDGSMSHNNENSESISNVSEAEIQTPEPFVPSGVGLGYGHDFRSLPTHYRSYARTGHMYQLRDQDEENESVTPLVDATNKKENSRTPDSGQTPQGFQGGNSSSEGTSGKVEFENSDFQENGFLFDICLNRNRSIPKLKSSLLQQNRASRSELKRRAEGENIKILRPGMILLKGYISLKDQIKLIKACRDLGLGRGGFYQPVHRDGAKLHLKMMCLGQNWDPKTSTYSDRRPIDDTKPPSIPDEFQQLVKGALQECHSYLEAHSKGRNMQGILPSMSPNICIVNFYTKSGKLGLHQDKDESQESIRKGLPVVSFSLGDSAEFLFGDQRDVDEADKVVLDSGDVLIFGGASRLIYHGVSAIKSETAPKPLLEETDLRPGRLNLTFREY
ncbi:hypothetical protein OROGR_005131 [Orobanche gracilis]